MYALFQRRKTMQTVIRCFLGAAVAASLGGFGYLVWLNHSDFEHAMVVQTQQLLLTLARAQAQSLEKHIGDIQQKLYILATSTVFHRSFKERFLGDTDRGHAALEDSYRDVKRLVDAIYLIDTHGMVMGCSPQREGEAGKDISQVPDVAIALVSRRPCISTVFRQPSGALALAILQPVFEGDAFTGVLRAVLSIERIHNLCRHINLGESIYAFVLDGSGMFMSYPDDSLLGKDMATAMHEKFPGLDMAMLKREVRFMEKRSEGMGIAPLPSDGIGPSITSALIAFAPIRIGANVWSMAVAMDYGAISGPIHKNIRDNLLFVGFVFLIIGVLGAALHRVSRRRIELVTSTKALHIINRQLHLEIDERRKIEKALHDSLRKGRGAPQ
ncbi:MAG: cache domain-containing protein [Candidatus Aureabacteria bacterium]|nr:cache domain-containing protein [Candidatus Auribacterota bacterium]